MLRAARWPRKAPGLAASAALLSAATACGAILGIGDPAFESSDRGGDDGSADGGAGDGLTPPGPPCCEGGGCGYLNDDQNCGACFHSCLGGPCSDAGVCQPFPLAGSPATNSGLWSGYGLTLLDGTLYGTNWYATLALVYETSATIPTEAGVGPRALFPDPRSGTTGMGSANEITTDGKELFFAVFQSWNETWTPGLYSLTTSGVGTLIYQGEGIGCLGVDDAGVYFGGKSGDVYRVGKAGGAPTSLGTSDRASSFSVVDGLVYYGTSHGVVAVDTQTFDKVLTFDGPADAGMTDAGSASQADDFDVTDGYVVWVNLLTHTLYKSTSQTSTIRLDTSTIPFQRSYAAVFGDPARGQIYLIDTDIGWGTPTSISRIADDGSSAQVVATIGDGVSAAIQDATAIYFVSYGNVTTPPYTAVYKLAK